MIPDAVKRFIEIFSRLPSVGPRMATRLAFYITSLDRNTFRLLQSSLNALDNLDRCGRCFFIKEKQHPLCTICSNSERNPRVICIIQKETDLITIEQAARFHGTYFLLGEISDRGLLDSSQKLKLHHLKEYIKRELQGTAEEILVAFPSTSFGDLAYQVIQEEFRDVALRITRLARGIPTGGEIEFADEETLRSAIEGRG